MKEIVLDVLLIFVDILERIFNPTYGIGGFVDEFG